MKHKQNKTANLAWGLEKFQRRLRYEAYRALYQDRYPALERSILIAGTARSGTTWLADIIASQLPARMMFEPFHPLKVPALRNLQYFQYLRPEEPHPGLEAFAARLFAGSIRDAWIDRQVEHLRPEYRVIKEVRANLLLAWLTHHFPAVPTLLLLRHPCAVVLSHLELGWHSTTDLASMLAQEQLVDDYLADKMRVIESARTPEEIHALVWCIHSYVPMRQFRDPPWQLVFYENLCTQPEIEIPRIFEFVGQPYAASVFDMLNRPSNTARHDSAVLQNDNRISGWQRKLSQEQIASIQGIVQAFELDFIYEDGLTPRVERL